ncbi:hypothetical protein NEOLEDRAFT_1148783 [Neolentinus lepideus HHB14362 ss-1]|uniref:Oxysterol-binding protein n=1 Tax=Neolentinus lepideus HHB14362 ss-1 TaxID=1314782 RepID=A0A165RQT8_9AGAM|nr:hypothetical protein NEOLEDRAFT_1148783 [Neolentinus lepideus HHB14362 ss-1]
MSSSPGAVELNEYDPDAPGPAISVPDSGDTGEGGKLKMIVQLLKKCLGVKDIAAMRLSLPASLLEPIPNLEYWHYLDRPDLFAAINDSDDAFERMLAVIRFTFTKDLKFIRGKVCKPYNSVLGEHFRCTWDVIPVKYSSDPMAPPIHRTYVASPSSDSSSSVSPNRPVAPGLMQSTSETASVKSAKSTKSTKSARSGFSFMSSVGWSTPATSPPLSETNLEAQMSDLSLSHESSGEIIEEDEAAASEPRVRIVYLTEQISHHPPISAYHTACPSRQIELTGIDQISAKVSGATVRVGPGSFNKGLFIRITGGAGEGEMYHVTHPVAQVAGILRGNFYVTIGDSTIITCTGGKGKERLRAILEYKEESWLGKAHFAVEGVIHTYTEGESEVEEWTKVKHVPQSRVLAVFEGSWRGFIRWRRASSTTPSAPSPAASQSYLSAATSLLSSGYSSASSASTSRSDLSGTTASPSSSEWATLIDLTPLHVVPKSVRPLEKQLPDESRKLWEDVTTRLLKKEYSEATRHKHAIEQKQRDDAAERKRKGVEFIPKYFEKDIESGVPALTAEGRKQIEQELQGPSTYPLEGKDAAAAKQEPS